MPVLNIDHLNIDILVRIPSKKIHRKVLNTSVASLCCFGNVHTQ